MHLKVSKRKLKRLISILHKSWKLHLKLITIVSHYQYQLMKHYKHAPGTAELHTLILAHAFLRKMIVFLSFWKSCLIAEIQGSVS